MATVNDPRRNIVVGRDAELAVVRAAARTRYEESQSVLITGPPGIGKSALVEAALEGLDAEVLYIREAPLGTHGPFETAVDNIATFEQSQRFEPVRQQIAEIVRGSPLLAAPSDRGCASPGCGPPHHPPKRTRSRHRARRPAPVRRVATAGRRLLRPPQPSLRPAQPADRPDRRSLRRLRGRTAHPARSAQRRRCAGGVAALVRRGGSPAGGRGADLLLRRESTDPSRGRRVTNPRPAQR